MKDLPFVTELTINEQEKLSGGSTGATAFFVINDGTVESQCGDVARLPNGTLIRDNNCFDDPIVW